MQRGKTQSSVRQNGKETRLDHQLGATGLFIDPYMPEECRKEDYDQGWVYFNVLARGGSLHPASSNLITLLLEITRQKI